MSDRRIHTLFVVACALVLIGTGLSWWGVTRMIRDADQQSALFTARAIIHKEMALREWIASLGGIYVPVTEKTPSNPLLPPQGRDLYTPAGVKLTRVNPSYASRLVNEPWLNTYGISSHLTSLKPLRAENYPHEWEADALMDLLDSGATEYFGISHAQGEDYARFIQPLFMQRDCLVCHATQGYQVGDQRGGISVSFPLAQVSASRVNLWRGMASLHMSFAALALLGLALFRHMLLAERERNADTMIALREMTTSLAVRAGDGATNVHRVRTSPQGEENKREESARQYQEVLRENEKQRHLLQEYEALFRERQHYVHHDFLARLSSEIRSPLNAILSMNYLLEQSGLNEQQRNYTAQTKLAGHGLLTLISDILDYAKMESGKLQIVNAPFYVPEVLDSVCGTLNPIAQEKGLSLRMELEEDFPKTLMGDAYRFCQVLTKLLGNTIHFAERGEIVLQGSLKEKQALSVTLEFRVQDMGMSISAECRKTMVPSVSLFEEDTDQDCSTGLDLAISKRLVELMGGELRLESPPNTFSVTMKLEIDEEAFERVGGRGEFQEDSRAAEGLIAEKPAVEDLEKPVTPATLRSQVRYTKLSAIRGAKVLLVEDNDLNQEVALNLLKSYGMEVSLASNGIDAVLTCRNALFDMVFMAVSIPVMDGLEATRRIRAFVGKRLDEMPIVGMISGVSLERERYLGAGLNGVMTLPVDPEEMAALLLQWINPQKVQQAALLAPQDPDLSDRCLLLPKTLPGVDLTQALHHIGGRTDSLIKHLLRFNGEYSAWTEHLATLMNAGQWDAAGRNAHTLRAVASSLAMNDVAAAVREVEQAYARREICPELLTTLQEQLDMVCQGIEAAFLALS